MMATEGYRRSLWAIVPVKPLHQGKMRLAHLLSVEKRIQLMVALLSRTLSVLAQAADVHKTLVVSGDKTVLGLARQKGASGLDEGNADGLNNAVFRAVQVASEKLATAALILPADLPLIRLEDVKLMTRIVPNARAGKLRQEMPLGICSDTKQDGTNALLLGLPTAFTFAYGPRSFHRHLQEAARIGLSTQIIHSPGLEFDLDTEEDWERYQKEITHAIDL